MCGIAGWIDWQQDLRNETQTLKSMAQSVAHRGPDTEGLWISRHAGLAHRRLVVVDPVGGAQPMAYAQGEREYVLVYNGELYNTEDVRRELVARGHTFRSYSDTEVLLHAYVEWGAECLARLNGIFAFAVWEEREQTLFLARDRLGVKPLFFSRQGSTFLFGSEIKAILANPAVPARIDSTGLAELLLIGPARTPGTGLFRGIEELKPGHYMMHSPRGTSVNRYWQLESREHEDDLHTTQAKVRELVIDAVKRQLISDVPVCTLLSGGLDSSAITALATRQLEKEGKGRLHTYSIDFSGNDRSFQANEYQPDADEPWVQRMSGLLVTTHHRLLFDTKELMEALLLSMRANDYPGMTDIDASLLLFCREIKKHHTVALSGEAADEVFGGYPWFTRQESLQASTFPWALKNKERFRVLSPDLVRALRPEEYVENKYRQALSEVPCLAGETGLDARLREMSYLNITRFMPTLLDRKDRMSMACGLEVRVPFTDHRLVEYVWNIPWSMKQVDGREKGILRRAMQGILPADVLYRKKSPYPKTHNPAYLRATRDWLLEILADQSSPLHSLLDVPTVRQIAQNNGLGFGPTWFGQLMGAPQLFAYLALIDAWLREYKVSIIT